ncbi:integrase arm-type DNA-binding domain-containing protein [Alcanivorax sp. 1008]|uniref:tyrosine-type recombinase/integrase n=1 Tax=Alcanivorax sp. 1008 TaxID=2816853 RepID=UPI001D2104EE|nr:integrase arm-type DNA-binding domain-containing protein [Alcanivorax sp. 1008]MCC1497959.1 tyrosine-type recombinase/integrase [Alcanivorax sp. 1008]
MKKSLYPQMKLSATGIKNAQPGPKDYKIFDGGGLYLLVKKNGSKYWRYKYRYRGKEKVLAIGVYPVITLKEARNKHLEAKRLLVDGIDPNEQKQRLYADTMAKYHDTFEKVAREWWSVNKEEWSDDHANRVILSLEKDVFPYIGAKPIKDIKTPEVLSVLRRVESRDALDLASRLLQRCNSVFKYAVQTGKATFNPAVDLSGVLKTRKVQHQASLSRNELPEFLKRLDGYEGARLTTLALKLLIYTFVRPGELRGAQWDEFDLEDRMWRIPAERMKMKTPHLVPLSDQVISLLEEICEITGKYDFLFPGERNRKKSMSENTMTFAIYRLGYKGKATGHGFRATASSILNEEGFNRDAIERQLAHMERNDVRAAYVHHAEYLDDRKQIMQWWGNYLVDAAKK